jgi:hypothetical protein
MLYVCIVDIVPVSTEPPLGDDQEQLFEEEEVFAVAEEGKWSSPPACSLFVLYNCIINNVYFYDIFALIDGKTFLRTYLDLIP